jgi:hypothetical protein
VCWLVLANRDLELGQHIVVLVGQCRGGGGMFKHPPRPAVPPYTERVFGALGAHWVMGDCLSHVCACRCQPGAVPGTRTSLAQQGHQTLA